MGSKVNILTLDCGEGKYIYFKAPVNEYWQLMFKTP